MTPDRIRQIFKALETGDGAAFFAHVADNVDWTVMGTHPLAGHYRSKADYAGTFVKLGKVLPQGAQLSALAGSATKSGDYARKLIARLCPTMLPYVIGTPAGFDFASFNGRALGDDVVDVILTLASNTALGDGVVPDKARIRSEFPYFGKPYTRAEQADVTPAPQHSQK